MLKYVCDECGQAVANKTGYVHIDTQATAAYAEVLERRELDPGATRSWLRSCPKF